MIGGLISVGWDWVDGRRGAVVLVGCQKSVTCSDLDIHVRCRPAMKIKTTHSSPTADDMMVFS
jgi:hypothetical protein